MATPEELHDKKVELENLKKIKDEFELIQLCMSRLSKSLPVIDKTIKNIESNIYTEFLWYNKKEKVEVGRRLAVCESPRYQHILYYEDLGREQAGRDGFINTHHLLYTDTDGIQALYDTVKEYNKGI
jgi:hypothetical protein